MIFINFRPFNFMRKRKNPLSTELVPIFITKIYVFHTYPRISLLNTSLISVNFLFVSYNQTVF